MEGHFFVLVGMLESLKNRCPPYSFLHIPRTRVYSDKTFSFPNSLSVKWSLRDKFYPQLHLCNLSRSNGPSACYLRYNTINTAVLYSDTQCSFLISVHLLKASSKTLYPQRTWTMKRIEIKHWRACWPKGVMLGLRQRWLFASSNKNLKNILKEIGSIYFKV